MKRSFSLGARFTSPARGFAAAVLIVAIGFLGSRLLGLVRTAVIADTYGASSELSAYWVAFRLPDLIFQVLAGATLASAFIPAFSRYVTHQSEEQAWRMTSSILNLIAVATAVFAIIAFALAPVLIPVMAPGLGEATGRQDELHSLAVDLTRIMLISPVLFSVSGMMMGILNARHSFLLPAIAPMLYNVGIIFGALALSGPFGVHGLAAGVVIGSALHLAVQVPGLFRIGMRYVPALDWRDPGVREVGRLMLPRVIGLGAGQINFIVATIFASRLGDEVISALTYAWLLTTVPLALFGMAISTAIFPTMSQQAASNSTRDLQRTILSNLRLILFLTLPASIGLIILREPAVALILERGAFQESSTGMTASALAFYCIGLPAHAAIEIFSRGFYALGDTRTPVSLAVFSMILNVIFSLILVGPLEHDGLALALSLATLIEGYLLYIRLQRRLGGLEVGYLSNFLLRVGAATALMTEVVALLVMTFDNTNPLGNSTAWQNLIVVSLAVTTGAIAFFVTAHVLHCEEADILAKRIGLPRARKTPPVEY